MKVKKALQTIFKEEKQLDQKKVILLQNTILKDLKKDTHPHGIHRKWAAKFIIAPALALLILLFFINNTPSQISHTPVKKGEINHSFIKIVSAQDVLQAMQASINSERLHIIMTKQTNKDDDSNISDSFGNYSVSEAWVDRKSKRARFEAKDSQNRLRFLLIHHALTDKTTKTVQFLTGSMHSFDINAKQGLYISRIDGDNYQEELDLTLREDYVKTLIDSGAVIETNYQDIQYNGKNAYKLTINYPKDKNSETLIIDKETKLPFEDTFTETDYPEVKGGTLIINTKYSFSTDFSDDVFSQMPPEGYSLVSTPTITDFSFSTVSQNEKQLSVTVNYKNLLFNNKVSLDDGFMLDRKQYKLYMAKESFSSFIEAKLAFNLHFEAIPSHPINEHRNNTSYFVYTLPDLLGKKDYGVFKLEVLDENGKKLYEVYRVENIHSLF
jgi:hypothetical protein